MVYEFSHITVRVRLRWCQDWRQFRQRKSRPGLQTAKPQGFDIYFLFSQNMAAASEKWSYFVYVLSFYLPIFLLAWSTKRSCFMFFFNFSIYSFLNQVSHRCRKGPYFLFVFNFSIYIYSWLNYINHSFKKGSFLDELVFPSVCLRHHVVLATRVKNGFIFCSSSLSLSCFVIKLH